MNEAAAARLQIREASTRFAAALASLDAAQWRFRPAPGQWSPADVAEHVAIANGNLGRALAARLLESPIGSAAVAVTDAEIPYLFYRGEEPPGVAAPTGALVDPAQGVAAIETSARSILDWADGVHADLRAFGLPHPVFGLLDGVQWLLFAGAHMERHRAQLVGLQRHREFPA